MSQLHDAVVVGGGPAGLAFAAGAAARGLDVVVLERREGDLDKACGEGVLPSGRRFLESLGVLPLVDPAEVSPLRELRWCDPCGLEVALRLPGEGGLGIRRTALAAALRARAETLGAQVRSGSEVVGHVRAGDRIAARVRGGETVEARVLVAADGLLSPTRRREGLDAPVGAPPRFGIRRHFGVAPWGEAVEVHFGQGAEAYLTPAGRTRVGLALLFERGGKVRFEDLLGRFPRLQSKLAGAPTESTVRGVGPLERRARARVADRLVLLGDAAGYLDAVTGDGLSLAFGCAADLAELLPRALSAGADARALGPYEVAWRRRFRAYALWTRLVLLLTRRPGLRRAALRLVAARRPAFERIVAAAVG
ncbi:MAG TPA: FAD-dependent monooxygenase [Anaeromyxobacter sp.]|nr:FAD-dependent monooxygenase [Anaeromyxobacter sp.]HVO18221.1 FAD-dependent monooxygenase [Anaeromyxobacter sp.]